MTTPYLPDDCIHYILKYLQPYRSTLFNCLLVNRFWCKATVPLLYADPIDSIPIIKKHSIYPIIILTLILCLNKTDVLELKNQLKRLININDININDEYKPLFDYPKYIENYHYYSINSMILHWIRSQTRNRLYCIDCDERSKFEAIFHQSILRQCSNNIKLLEIPVSFNYEVQTLPKLNSLVLHVSREIASEFLNNLANICLNLRKLEIIDLGFDSSNEKIYTVIQKQNNLKALRLRGFSDEDDISFKPIFFEPIFLSLESQKNSLVFIEFRSINFSNISFENFINLCNLKYLKFNSCGEMPLEKCEILKFASFKLEALTASDNQWNINIMPIIIKYLGASLKKLVSGEILTVPIIENISIYCLNLITLEVEVSSNYSSIIPYFKYLKIRTLSLFSYIRYEVLEDFINLANNLLTSVKEVSIWYLNDPQYFKVFLENCHSCLEIIRLIYPSLKRVTDLLKIILSTERSNDDLKFFIFYYDENNQKDNDENNQKDNDENNQKDNDEKLELLDQIKAKGIKVAVVPYKDCDFEEFYYCY